MITCKFEDGINVALRHVSIHGILLNKEHDKILLIRRSGLYAEPHKLAWPGGHMNRDETLTEGVVREVKEETGYGAANLSLFCISDNIHRLGGDRQNIDFYFLGDIGEKVGEHDQEIEQVIWFDVNNLPKKEELAFDHGDILEKYLIYRKDQFTLPIFIH
jgi:8-oxo-dGTP diphosphatase